MFIKNKWDEFPDIFALMDDFTIQCGLRKFAQESNLIEGINSEDASKIHYNALNDIFKLKKLTVGSIQKFVFKIQPNGRLRKSLNDMVRIGGNIAPTPSIILPSLKKLLKKISNNEITPWHAHVEYEYLHPFMDGNGRSGRAIWLWQMCRYYDWMFQLSFQHKFYYQTLQMSNFFKKN